MVSGSGHGGSPHHLPLRLLRWEIPTKMLQGRQCMGAGGSVPEGEQGAIVLANLSYLRP